MDFKKISNHKAPAHSPGFLLWNVSTLWRSCVEENLKPLGLTHPQFVVLATLGWLTRDGSLVTQAAIGKMASLDPNTASQIINVLEKKQLIKREPSSDGRAKNPMLTSKGKNVLTEAMPAVESADQHFFKSLSPEQKEIMVQLFQTLLVK